MDFFIKEELAVATPNIMELFAKESSTVKGKRTNKRFVVEIAALHEGTSKNYNRYTAAALTEAVDTWLMPYPKPILINHDINTEPLGRIIKSAMAKNVEGVSYIQLRAALSDPAAIAKVLDGRYLTGSVGAMPSGAICSICSTDVVNASKAGQHCGHERGHTYEGETCVYEHKGISFYEYSFVNAPGDTSSLVLNHFSEEYTGKLDVYSVDTETQAIHKLTENDGAVNILEHMDTHSANMLFSDLAYGTKFVEHDALAGSGSKDQIQESTNNISFAGNTRTIENEPDSSDQELGNMTKQISEDNQVEVSEDEDILDVADRLADTLAEPVVESDEVTETPADEVVQEEVADESAEVVAEEGADEVADDANKDEVVEEAADEVVQEAEDAPEETEEAEPEAPAEDGDVTDADVEDAPVDAPAAEEAAPEVTVNVEELQAQIAVLVAENATLKTQNAKMKDALHTELVEKVVDARISVGLLDAADRVEALETFKTRSAASLGDALVDIRQYAEKNNFEVNVVKGMVPSLEIRALATSDDSSQVETVTEGEEVHEVVVNEKDEWVNKFSELLVRGEQKFLSGKRK